MSLHWRHNDNDGVSSHQPHGCLLNRLFRRRWKKTSKLRVTGLCVGNSPGPVNSPHKGPVTRKMFPFDDVIMWSSTYGLIAICPVIMLEINKLYATLPQRSQDKQCGSSDKGQGDHTWRINTLRPRQKDISQTTSSSAFSSMKMFEFRSNFQRSLFLRVQLTIFQHWFR